MRWLRWLRVYVPTTAFVVICVIVGLFMVNVFGPWPKLPREMLVSMVVALVGCLLSVYWRWSSLRRLKSEVRQEEWVATSAEARLVGRWPPPGLEREIFDIWHGAQLRLLQELSRLELLLGSDEFYLVASHLRVYATRGQWGKDWDRYLALARQLDITPCDERTPLMLPERLLESTEREFQREINAWSYDDHWRFWATRKLVAGTLHRVWSEADQAVANLFRQWAASCMEEIDRGLMQIKSLLLAQDGQVEAALKRQYEELVVECKRERIYLRDLAPNPLSERADLTGKIVHGLRERVARLLETISTAS